MPWLLARGNLLPVLTPITRQPCRNVWMMTADVRLAGIRSRVVQLSQSNKRRSNMNTQSSESEPTCLSGGAEGADKLFGKLASAAGHKVVHFGFKGMQSSEAFHALNAEELAAASPHVNRAAVFLQRNPPRKAYVRKLIQRNYYQVSTAESIYAVTRWNQVGGRRGATEEGRLGGGTGWAVAMGIAVGVPQVYLFAMEKAQWYRYSYERKKWERVASSSVPGPTGRYAGIGSRDLDDAGVKAISSLYGDGQHSFCTTAHNRTGTRSHLEAE